MPRALPSTRRPVPPPPARTDPLPRNRILAALPDEDRDRLLGQMECVELELREVLFEPNRAIRHVYFPEDAVVSVLAVVDDGSAIETATVGNEGMVGVPVFLGAMQMAAQAFAQVPGRAYRMPSAALIEEVRSGSALAGLLGRYTQALLTLVSQCSACNRMHPVEERCARWLLMTHDRVPGDSFELTHLFLSQMLGVRRATVSEVAARLQARRLIEYARGRVAVTDRAGLEAASCACYAIVRREFARLLGGASEEDPLAGVAVSEDGRTTAGDGGPGLADEP